MEAKLIQIAGASLLLVMTLFLLPLATVRPLAAAEPKTLPPPVTVPPRVAVPEMAEKPPAEPAPVMLRVLRGEQVTDMELETYLLGVVRGEMPASFAPEALKAQAVAARTYTLYQLSGGGRHGDADVCTDPSCCQAYLEEQEARAKWGDRAEEYLARTAEAVRATAGETLLYEDRPILAAFHASSPGRTRSAGEVWGREVPYLQPVSSPETLGRDSVTFSAGALREYLDALGCTVEGSPSDWLRNAVTDPAGNVETVEAGDATVTGTELRQALGLRSACFSWKITGEEFTFYTSGHGHGVGMSQYGADAMARAGSDYREILAHYYPGTELKKRTPQSAEP